MSNRYVRIKDEYLVREDENNITHIIRVEKTGLGDALCGKKYAWRKRGRINLYRCGCEACNEVADKLKLFAEE